MVVYGLNGSGKSSFVDAVEYVLKDGKIGHLLDAFEQSKKICYHYYDDPNWSQLVWGPPVFEEERRLVGGRIAPSWIPNRMSVT